MKVHVPIIKHVGYPVKVPEIHPRPVVIEHHTPIQIHKNVHYSEKEFVPIIEDHHHHHHSHHGFDEHHDGYWLKSYMQLWLWSYCDQEIFHERIEQLSNYTKNTMLHMFTSIIYTVYQIRCLVLSIEIKINGKKQNTSCSFIYVPI